MPTYSPLFKRFPEVDDLPMPRFSDYSFRSPADVVEFARHDRCIGWATWPDVWHLDQAGRLCCGYHGSTLDRLDRWAANPYRLVRARREGLRSPEGCAPNWLIVENRTLCREDVPPSELDQRSYVVLRTRLEEIGVNLVDAVIFDADCHWWSMHDLEHPGRPYELR